MKKFLLILSVFWLFLALPVSAITIDFFFSPTCPHCAEEEEWLEGLSDDIEINRYSVFEEKNVNLLKDYYNNYGVPSSQRGLVPATFIDDQYFVGFNQEVKASMEKYISTGEYEFISGGTTGIDEEGNVNLPLIGMVNVNDFSLPVLAVLLGTLDGFNVCSLGALILILGLVLALKSRRKIFLFGGIFILTTAITYGVLIIIWYQIFSLFVPYLGAMKILIGLLGIGGSLYFFHQFWKFKKYGPNCDATAGNTWIDRATRKLQKLFSDSRNVILLALGVLLFSFIVAVLEFPCSAVIPVAFAGILSQAGLSSAGYLSYITLFILFYMLDEIIVFLVAFFTMKIWFSSSKVTTWVVFAEAVILLVLGVYYLL